MKVIHVLIVIALGSFGAGCWLRALELLAYRGQISGGLMLAGLVTLAAAWSRYKARVRVVARPDGA